MDKEQLSAVKAMLILGIICVVANLGLLYLGQTGIGISGIIIGAYLTFINYKKIKASKTE